MARFCSFILGGLVALVATFAQFAAARATPADFQTWMQWQSRIAKDRMFRNISPQGTVPGVVIASPSRRDPNYYYHWIRDASLVMETVRVLRDQATGAERAQADAAMMDFVRFSRRNQVTPTSTGLGDPRFNVDGKADYEPWGRPQNDGPALRAIVLTRFAKTLLREGRRDLIEREFYRAELPPQTVVKADLEYIAHNWHLKSFDPWEEIRGHHFFHRAVALSALREGAELAELLGDSAAAEFYLLQARVIESRLANHWSDSKGYYLATLESEAGADHRKPSELDMSVILGVLASDGLSPLHALDGKILATVSALENMFASIYYINKSRPDLGTAFGRYAEDYYFGGNPWILTTAGIAEFHFRVAAELSKRGSYQVSEQAVAFFDSCWPANDPSRPKIRAGDDLLAGGEQVRQRWVRALREKGDGFLRRLHFHANPDGSFSEQYDRNSGAQISAYDLTWSYASFLQAIAARGN